MYREHGCLRKDGGDSKAAGPACRCDDRACESGRRRGMSGRSSVPHGDRGAFTTLTNVSFDDDAIRAQIEKTHREKERLLAAPVKKSAGPREKAAGESGAAASVQDTDDYNLGLLWDMDLISAP